MGTAHETPRGHEQVRGQRGNLPNDLRRVKDLDDIEVADNETDPRGWDVYGHGDEKIGGVDGLVGSPSTMEVHFLIVDTGGWFSNKHYLIPIDQVEFRDKKVYTHYTKEHFERAPEWNDDERDFNRHYAHWAGAQRGAATGATTTDRTRTDHQQHQASGDMQRTGEMRVPVVEEEAAVRRDRVQSGNVTLRKRVEERTEHISEPVTNTKVSVERRDVSAEEADRYDTSGAQLREGETLRVPVVEEQVEVEKRPRVTEEVVVRADTETTRMERDVPVRREVVDVDTEGDIDVDNEATTGTRRNR